MHAADIREASQLNVAACLACVRACTLRENCFLIGEPPLASLAAAICFASLAAALAADLEGASDDKTWSFARPSAFDTAPWIPDPEPICNRFGKLCIRLNSMAPSGSGQSSTLRHRSWNPNLVPEAELRSRLWIVTRFQIPKNFQVGLSGSCTQVFFFGKLV